MVLGYKLTLFFFKKNTKIHLSKFEALFGFIQ